MEDRYYWADVCAELRRIMIEVEKTTKAELNVDTGVWIEQITTKPGLGGGAAGGGMFNPQGPMAGGPGGITMGG